MANHLIIGLGGTGGKVLREFRRRLFEEYGTSNFENPKAGEYFEYVYVDSSENDLNERWETMSTDISLGNAQKVNIHSVPNQMLANLNAYPGLNAFINQQDVTNMTNRIGQAITTGIGGQRRRLGRILLAANLAGIANKQNFEHTIRAAVGRLQQASRQQNVTFHICAGLAGGTGSGTIVDAISLLRRWFPYDATTHNNKIISLLYVPESIMVNQNHDAGYYQANGYAALQELNALALGQYQPLDITGRLMLNGQHARIAAGFEAAYLYSNVSENGCVKDLQRKLPADVAEFLFQSTSMAGGQLQRLCNCENNPPIPENDASGNPAHSCQFMTFGVTRVEYPEVEIRQYATYSFVLQSIRGLLYNHWVNGIGYDVRNNNQIGLNYSTEVREEGTLKRLKLEDEYLSLSIPISNDGANNWLSIRNSWETFAERAVTAVMRHPDKSAWATKLSTMMGEYYANGFRNLGVNQFYNVQMNNLNAYATMICEHIENELFKEWIAGTMSIIEIEKYVAELITYGQVRIQNYNNRVATENQQAKTYSGSASHINQDYNNINFINDLLGRSNRLIQKYKDELEKQYRHETMACAMQYAQALLTQLVGKLQLLGNTLNDVNNLFVNIANSAIMEIGSRCTVNNHQDGIIRQYDPNQIRGIIKEFEQTKRYQDQSLNNIRQEIVNKIGNVGHETFSLMNAKIDPQNTVSIILRECEQVAVSAMTNYGQNNPTNRLIDVNILEKLRTTFAGPNDLKTFVNDVLSEAFCNFQPDNTQAAALTAQMPHMIQVRIPDAVNDDDITFRNKLIATFSQQFAGFNASSDVAPSDKSNRIVVISAYGNMPIRVMSNTAILKEGYDNLVSPNNQNHSFNKMLLHTENFQSNTLPPLFDLTQEEVKEMAFEPLLLALALEMLPQHYDQMRGKNVYALMENSPTGDIPHPLGVDFAECWTTLEHSHKLTRFLINQVNQKMSTIVITASQKNDIIGKIGDVLQEHILPSLCENNVLDPNWAYFTARANRYINDKLR